MGGFKSQPLTWCGRTFQWRFKFRHANNAGLKLVITLLCPHYENQTLLSLSISRIILSKYLQCSHLINVWCMLTANLRLSLPRSYTPKKIDKSSHYTKHSLDCYLKAYASRIHVVEILSMRWMHKAQAYSPTSCAWHTTVAHGNWVVWNAQHSMQTS